MSDDRACRAATARPSGLSEDSKIAGVVCNDHILSECSQDAFHHPVGTVRGGFILVDCSDEKCGSGDLRGILLTIWGEKRGNHAANLRILPQSEYQGTL